MLPPRRPRLLAVLRVRHRPIRDGAGLRGLPVAVLLSAGLLLGLVSGCQDPCVALAERICQCQEDPGERIACRQERVTNQRDRFEISDEDRSVCTAALDTCTCAALDRNETHLCGFATEGPPEGSE